MIAASSRANRAESSDPLASTQSDRPDRSAVARRLFLASIAVALIPIAVAAARAIHGGYVPVGDDAFFAIRARDVFSSHRPLLGLATSASNGSGAFQNAGPLLFDVLALPTTLSGNGAGLVVGVALLNASAVLGVAVFAYRRGGALLGAGAMMVTAVLCWAMGSSVLFDPTQPSSLLLAFLCFVMAVWSITCGDLAALVWGGAIGSLILQSYVTYGYLVVILASWAVLGLLLRVRTDRRSDPSSWPTVRRRVLRAAAATTLVAVACWAQPLWQEFAGPGAGNLSRLVTAVGRPQGPIGYKLGTRLLAEVVARPPWWVRPSFREYLAANGPLHFGGNHTDAPPLALAVLSLAVLAALLAWCAWFARRHHDRDGGRAIATAAVLLAAGLITAGRMPIGVFGRPTAHTFRWLWPLAAFVVFAVASTLLHNWHTRRRAVELVATLAVATAVFAALNLPASDQGASEDGSANAAMRDLGGQMRVLETVGPLLIVPPTSFAEPYTEALWAQLQRRGIPFVTRDPSTLAQVGLDRRFTGRNARSEVFVTVGQGAAVTTPNARPVGFHPGLTSQEQRELSGLKDGVAGHIRAQGLVLNRRGAEAIRRGQLPPVPQLPGRGGADPDALLASRLLVVLVKQNLLTLDPVWKERFNRYASLQSRWDSQTVTLYLAPIR